MNYKIKQKTQSTKKLIWKAFFEANGLSESTSSAKATGQSSRPHFGQGAPLMLMHQVHTVLMGQSWTTFRSTHLICPLLPIHRAHSQTQQRLTQSEPSITSLKTISQAIPKTLNKSINEIQIGIHHQHLNWLKKTLTALEKSIKAMHQKLVIKAIKSISQTSHPSN